MHHPLLKNEPDFFPLPGCQSLSSVARPTGFFIVSTASRLRCCSIFVGRLLIYTALAKGAQNPFSYLILYIDIPKSCHQILSKKVFSIILTMKRIPSLRFSYLRTNLKQVPDLEALPCPCCYFFPGSEPVAGQ